MDLTLTFGSPILRVIIFSQGAVMRGRWIVAFALAGSACFPHRATTVATTPMTGAARAARIDVLRAQIDSLSKAATAKRAELEQLQVQDELERRKAQRIRRP